MSGIAKPLVHFTNSENADIMVNVDYIADVSPLDVVNAPGQPNKYYLVITEVLPNSETKTHKIAFATSVARNTSLGNLKSHASTAVA